MKFVVSQTDGLARLGTIETRHGVINSPAFMTVGTKGFVKTLDLIQLKQTGAEILLSNTYHLYLRPGLDIIKQAGGLHKFNGYDGPIITDSGGYQVFSLGRKRNHKLAKISDQDVVFTSHYDGSQHIFNPKKVIKIQHELGVDIAMPLDDCAEAEAEKEEVEKAMHRTHSWLKEAQEYWQGLKSPKPALFGIVQGGVFKEFRQQSAEFVSGLNLDGIAIGGVAVGEDKKKIRDIISYTAKLIPEYKPRYLMGVGEPHDLLFAIKHGLDMFDCVLPTRLARHGTIWQLQGDAQAIKAFWEQDTERLLLAKSIKIIKRSYPNPKNKNAQNSKEETLYFGQQVEALPTPFVNHQFKEREISIMQKFSLHNLTFLQNLLLHARTAIALNKYERMYEIFGIK